MMVPESGYANFNSSLYERHFEGLSFLYGQRNKLFSNPIASLRTLAAFEERIEAHIEGLVLGGEAALMEQAANGDAEELYAALRIVLRNRRIDLFGQLLEQQDPSDSEKIEAVIDALKTGLPSEWQENIVMLLEAEDLQSCGIAAMVIGHRRIPAADILLRSLRRHQSAPQIWAVGALRERGGNALLLPTLQNKDTPVASATVLSLLRIVSRQAVGHCLATTAEMPLNAIPLALSAGQAALPILTALTCSDKVTADIILALGILGDFSVVGMLLEKLQGPCAEAAAQALNLLTGAELHERVFVPEEVCEDELFPEELEAYRASGAIPTKPDGTPFGIWVDRLSHNREMWSEWWARNASNFHVGIRYRRGLPFSPKALLETLHHDSTPHKLRQLAYEELVIRYDAEFAFEADMFVADQHRALQTMAQWVSTHSGRFQIGRWYFSGQPC